MIFTAKFGFQIFNPAAITAEGPTLHVSRALLRHILFLGKIKMSKIEKDEDWVNQLSESFKMTLEIIFRAKLYYQIFNPAIILSERQTLKASGAILRHDNSASKANTVKNRKR